MSTGNSIVGDILRTIGRLGSGDTATATELTDGLAHINRMIGRWNAKLGPIYCQTAESLTWASGNASRTIGTGGNLNTDRPQKIILAQYRDANNVDRELPVLTFEEFQAIEDKATTATEPEVLGYNPTIASGLGTLYVYPVPTADFTLRLTSYKALTTISDGTATLTLPPGYDDAIYWGGLVRICKENGIDVDPYWASQAAESLAAIENINSTPPQIWPDYLAPGTDYSYGRDPVSW